MTNEPGKLGYPDLTKIEYVFDALLGHGMFTDKLPPCFASEDFLKFARQNSIPLKSKNHGYIEYRAVRHTNVPRQLAIPHPESYWQLCHHIKENWQRINEHIGKPQKKFNFTHVREIKNQKFIFKMNYKAVDKWKNEELAIDYSFSCQYVVSADISACFPSIYSHSIPWAIKGKKWAKDSRFPTWDNRNRDGEDAWPNDLDIISRSVKDGETNGLLIGPHSSNIISEIILTQIDCKLQDKGFLKVIRHIDDYIFYAKDELEAQNFLRTLDVELKYFELLLNAKKTKIDSFFDYTSDDWVSQLNQFQFPFTDNAIGFTTINSFVDYALKLSLKINNYAVVNYAIKLIAGKNLSVRAKRLYIKKMLQIALNHPYLLPLTEKYVFTFAEDIAPFLNDFLPCLLKKTLDQGTTDSLSFLFYYAVKYDLKINFTIDNAKEIIVLNDCISILLACKYAEKQENKDILNLFYDYAKKIINFTKREQDQYWLFLYEILEAKHLDSFLKKLKEENIRFYDIEYDR